MEIYGYTNEQVAAGVDKPSSLSEVTLVSNADDLREIAKFLNSIADQIDEDSDGFEHEHLSNTNETVSKTNIIVFNEAAL
ncbi:hypothetical protein FM037_17245 [Shewanella psychropiezotolerans]|uniref:Uncharacterized protein n=1 Tax=Shewanella psychropiezotolerans TaxID=2593655 RepID=A0ABX5WZV1_9GAMM|nr:hypothetical protein [Shewanella psychropiezotolerans]QDO84642.1 hypothetical protein FM037_17245 [Shewanella psychropiezotolerans]